MPRPAAWPRRRQPRPPALPRPPRRGSRRSSVWLIWPFETLLVGAGDDRRWASIVGGLLALITPCRCREALSVRRRGLLHPARHQDLAGDHQALDLRRALVQLHD